MKVKSPILERNTLTYGYKGDCWLCARWVEINFIRVPRHISFVISDKDDGGVPLLFRRFHNKGLCWKYPDGRYNSSFYWILRAFLYKHFSLSKLNEPKKLWITMWEHYS